LFLISSQDVKEGTKRTEKKRGENKELEILKMHPEQRKPHNS